MRKYLETIPALLVHGDIARGKSVFADMTLCWYGQNLSDLCSLNGISEHGLGNSAKTYSLPTIVHDPDPKKPGMVHDLIQMTVEGLSIVTRGTTRKGHRPSSSVLFTMNEDMLQRLAESSPKDES